MASTKKRVLSGMRPTGRLHIGHYFGALHNWIKLQNDPACDCFFFVADWHALTSDYADTSQIAQNTLEIGMDWLAAGLDPKKCTLFVQSQVPEHAELFLLLSMVSQLDLLYHLPSYKEQLDNLQGKDLTTFGFLGYPVLQSADITIYDADIVPVGEDQQSHVELTRKFVRSFNHYYGFEISDGLFSENAKPALRSERIMSIFRGPLVPPTGVPYSSEQKEKIKGIFWNFAKEAGRSNFMAWLEPEELRKYFNLNDVLREPVAQLTETPRVPGTDGRKMSKSYNNFILLGEDSDSIRKKVRGMMTDPARKLRTDKGNPDVCPVFSWHKLFSSNDTIGRVNKECRTAEIGCVDCKGLMADALVEWIEPMRERRAEYEANRQKVLEILDDGSKKARKVAQGTMGRVREAVFGWEGKRKEIGRAVKPAASED